MQLFSKVILINDINVNIKVYFLCQVAIVTNSCVYFIILVCRFSFDILKLYIKENQITYFSNVCYKEFSDEDVSHTLGAYGYL